MRHLRHVGHCNNTVFCAPLKKKAYDMQWTEEQRIIVQQSIMTNNAPPPPRGRVCIIEATAGSGKSTVLTGVSANNISRNSLFISLTNSVRHELANQQKNHLESMKIQFETTREAHHDYFRIGTSEIQIATLDSWVHQCLLELGYSSDDAKGNYLRKAVPGLQLQQLQSSSQRIHVEDFARKRIALLAELKAGSFPFEALDKYDFFILDEVQDLDMIFVDISVVIGEHFALIGKSAYFAGDMDQHIFGDATVPVVDEMRRRWQDETRVGQQNLLYTYNLTICFRCPPAHLKFVNKVFPHKRPIKWPYWRTDEGEKPILLVVPPDSAHRKASVIVEEICRAVVNDDYGLQDIVLVSPHSRVNTVYCHLENLLSARFCKTQEKITWLYTDGEHMADWSRTVNRLTLSSIHSNKGRTHKVVIVHGLMDGSLPRLFYTTASTSTSASTPASAVDTLASTVTTANKTTTQNDFHRDECLLFVALTRASQRLVLVLEDNQTDMTYFLRRSFANGAELSEYCTVRTSSSFFANAAARISQWTWASDKPAVTHQHISKNVSAWASEIGRIENVIPAFTSLEIVSLSIAAIPVNSVNPVNPVNPDNPVISNNAPTGSLLELCKYYHFLCNSDDDCSLVDSVDGKEEQQSAKTTTSCRDDVPELLKNRNLLNVFGHYGAIAFYRQLNLFPLPLAAYKYPIVTNLTMVENLFRYQRRHIQDILEEHVQCHFAGYAGYAGYAGCAASPITISPADEKLFIDQIVSTITEKYCSRRGSGHLSDEEMREITRVAAEMTRNPHGHVLSNTSLAVSCGVKTIVAAIKDYERPSQTKDLEPHTLWALALAMSAMNSGRFERPWLNSQMQEAVLHHASVPTLWSNIEAASEMVKPFVKDIEIPVYNAAHRLGGRVDMRLLDGSIFDIKCPAMSDTFSASSWVQLLLYAALATWDVPSVGVIDLAHGVIEMIDLRTEKLLQTPTDKNEFLAKCRVYLTHTLGYCDHRETS